MTLAVGTLLAMVAASLIAIPAATAASVAPAAAAPLVDSSRLASFDSQMFSLINGARANAGVPALQQSGGLTSLAVWWSAKMADGATGYQLEHNPNAWTMVTQYGASNRTAWAENVAAFSSGASAQAVFSAYMNSPGHRANILNSTYRYVGVGTMSGSKGAFNTMEFTDKVDGAPAASRPSTSKAKPTTSKAKPKPTTTKAKPKPTTSKPKSTTSKAKPAPSTSRPAPKTSTRSAPTTTSVASKAPVTTYAPAPAHQNASAASTVSHPSAAGGNSVAKTSAAKTKAAGSSKAGQPMTFALNVIDVMAVWLHAISSGLMCPIGLRCLA